jgi:glyoxylase-like metal-dependent hydrolase (beta-lactamase superfamily II)
VIIQRSMSDGYLSNSYVVADRPGGHGVLIDSGGPLEPILQAIADNDITITHLLLTHHHVDHVLHNADYVERFGCEIWGHPAERPYCDDIQHDLNDGDEIVSGDLTIRALHTPGHTVGMLALVVNDEAVFTGDTLFKGTVGGTLAPGHATYADLHRSIMDVLMKLPPETVVYPGHTDSTTIGEEWERNAFVRIWRGLDPEGNTPCTAFGRDATLVVRAPDYDGGTKCWVRFADDGADQVAPGSQVTGD